MLSSSASEEYTSSILTSHLNRLRLQNLGHLSILFLLGMTMAFVASSWSWPLVGDATLLHYCVFQLQHGSHPYRQLIDINLPGTYFVEWCVIRFFGYGALPWRIFDLLLLLAVGAGSLLLLGSARAWRSNVLPALWVAVVFALLHGRDGLTQLGQRDLIITALLALGFASLFAACRCPSAPGRLAGLAGFGLAVGAAATVKPLALLLLPAAFVRYAPTRMDARSRLSAHGAAFAGAALPLLAALVYLLHEDALGSFLDLMQHLVPLHSSLFRLPALPLLAGAVSSVMLPLFLLAFVPVVWSRPWNSVEGRLLLAGLLFGFVSYFIQGRGYPYHRYPLHFFLLVLTARAMRDTLRDDPCPQWVRGLSLLSFAFGTFVIAPRSLYEVLHFTPRVDTLDTALAAALKPASPGSVQCFDMAGGCVTTLLRLRLTASTGFLYDCYAFAPVQPSFAGEQNRYRTAWFAAMEQNPPTRIVVSSDECGPADHLYRKLDGWPALDRYLHQHYTLAQQWEPTIPQRWMGKANLPYGFRLYTRLPTPEPISHSAYKPPPTAVTPGN